MLIWHKLQFLRHLTETIEVLNVGKLQKINNSMWPRIKLFKIFYDALLGDGNVAG